MPRSLTISTGVPAGGIGQCALGRFGTGLPALMRQPVGPRAEGAVVDDAQRHAGAPDLAKEPLGEAVHVPAVRPQPRAEIEDDDKVGMPASEDAAWQAARQFSGRQELREAIQIERAGASGAEQPAKRRKQARRRHQVFVGDETLMRRRAGRVLIDRCCTSIRLFDGSVALRRMARYAPHDGRQKG